MIKVTQKRSSEKKAFNYTLSTIGLSQQQQDQVRQNILSNPTGLVLTARPVNQGMNPTLSVLQEVHSLYPNKKIVTLEDPIEYELPFAIQVESQSSEDYPDYLRGIMRHNTDIIYLDKMSNTEIATMVVDISSSKKLVLSTLHASGACEVVARLSAMGVSSNQLSKVLRGVISQQLVRHICTHCVKVSDTTQKEMPYIQKYIDRLGWKGQVAFVRGSGKDSQGELCTNCQGTGYSGTTPIFEVLNLSEKLSYLIAKSASTDELRIQAETEGFKPIWFSAIGKTLLGETTLEEIKFILSGVEG